MVRLLRRCFDSGGNIAADVAMFREERLGRKECAVLKSSGRSHQGIPTNTHSTPLLMTVLSGGDAATQIVGDDDMESSQVTAGTCAGKLNKAAGILTDVAQAGEFVVGEAIQYALVMDVLESIADRVIREDEMRLYDQNNSQGGNELEEPAIVTYETDPEILAPLKKKNGR
ncbi:Hypothetical predicted protein [Olea europaea subsp. europaea]|uniref:Uncharacterized protein n=1 Tax=Olea europaea subsp. europaea TaxID=158383 RepID=A0A8S0S8Y5_OLEEU|nr:Hypothetical predicted protein [Olea europaea subsp. europaea]